MNERDAATGGECATPIPTFSVVIATYNYGRFLGRAIRSVLEQRAELELIVVDDGSTDDTEKVICDYASDSRLRPFRTENGGQARAKNHGVAEARGEFVAFLDADDYWLPEKLSRQLSLFRKRQETGVVYSFAGLVDPNGRHLPFEMPPCHRGMVLPRLYGRAFIPFSTAVVRKRLLDQHGGFDESLKMGIDYHLWMRLSTVTEFDFVAEVTAFLTTGHAQMSCDLDGRSYWARLIEKRFQDEHPDLVTRQMERDCRLDAAFTDFRRFEKSDRRRALRAIAQMLAASPFTKLPYKSAARLVLVDLLRVVKR
jgi:glycosyltransferase involved in cell wall biosynthesis